MIERQAALRQILERVEDQDLLLTTTGMISREAFVTRDRPGNFYMIGSMGLLSALGLGLAVLSRERRVWVLEGDGSALMSLGTLSMIGAEAPENLVHIILDNEAYESTGGQPSISSKVELAEVAKECGYKRVVKVVNRSDLERAFGDIESVAGPDLMVIKTSLSDNDQIPRVSRKPTEIRDRFRNCVLSAP